MLRVLNTVFAEAFYKANTGFFLFFFFVFFGAVQGGSLVSYHLSLMMGILASPMVLLLVLCCWTAYHIKCTSFFLKTINSEEGRFLYTVQALPKQRQLFFYAVIYTAVYLPVLLYSILVVFIGLEKGCVFAPACILLYQALSVAVFIGVVHIRMNNWIGPFRLPSFSLPVKKKPLLFVLYYLASEKKNALLLIKSVSIALLYVALIWNNGPFKNDSFILFYLLIFSAHAVLPFLSVQFAESRAAFSRNLPVPLLKRAMAFVIPYTILMLPETVYLVAVSTAMPALIKLAYISNLIASLALLTAIQYSGAQSRDEYVKAAGGILFVSIFVLHVQAFWLWIGVQLVMAMLLFASGYYKFERTEEES